MFTQRGEVCNGCNFVCFSSRSVIDKTNSLMMGISYRCAPVCGNVDCNNNMVGVFQESAHSL